jgi:D-tagatose-1,6-bisphosphate aldolase subunit GatZ/KbaZ
MMKLYGLSDRVRYYWTDPAIASALEKLIGNIDSLDAPLGLVSQFVGCMLPVDPAVRLSERIIQTKVGTEVAKYRAACGARARPA